MKTTKRSNIFSGEERQQTNVHQKENTTPPPSSPTPSKPPPTAEESSSCTTAPNSSTHRHSAPGLHELSPRAAGQRSLGRVEQRPRRLGPRRNDSQALQEAVDPLLRDHARQLRPLLRGAGPRRDEQRRAQELARVRADVQRDLWVGAGGGRHGGTVGTPTMGESMILCVVVSSGGFVPRGELCLYRPQY